MNTMRKLALKVRFFFEIKITTKRDQNMGASSFWSRYLAVVVLKGNQKEHPPIFEGP